MSIGFDASALSKPVETQQANLSPSDNAVRFQGEVTAGELKSAANNRDTTTNYVNQHYTDESALFERLLNAESSSGDFEQTSTTDASLLGFNWPLPLNLPATKVLQVHSINSLNTTNSAASASHVTSAQSSLVATVSQHITQAVMSSQGTGNMGFQQFSILIPNQGALNVQAQIGQHGIRAMQLSAEDEKFNKWLEHNASALGEHMSQALGQSVNITTGAAG